MSPDRAYNAAVDFLDLNVAAGRADKPAFIDPRRTLTYRQLLDAAARVGPMLARFGVERENRIALAVVDCVEFPILFWGAIRAGIIPVLLNTSFNENEPIVLTPDQALDCFLRTDMDVLVMGSHVLEKHARSRAS